MPALFATPTHVRRLGRTLGVRAAPLMLLCLPLVQGCQFISIEQVIPSDERTLLDPAEHVLAVTDDLSRLIVLDYRAPDGSFSSLLKVFDTATGDLVAGLPFALVDDLEIKAVSADPVHTDQFWTLHANGYRYRWSSDLTAIHEGVLPIPAMGVNFEWREYIDMDIAADGTVFITTNDHFDGTTTGYLYRDDGNGWDRANDRGNGEFLGKTCRVSVDEVNGEAVLLDDQDLVRYEPDLSFDRVTALPGLGLGEHYADLDTLGGRTVVAAVGNQVQIIDNLTGAIDASWDVGRAAAVTLETSIFDPSGTVLYGWYVGPSVSNKWMAERYKIGF